MNKFIRAVKHPKLVGNYILTRVPWLFSDKMYLRLKFYFEMGYWMDFKCPKTFNEKLQWLKLYDRQSEYVQMVDKIEVKKYIAKKLGEEYVIPTLDIWDTPDDIDFDTLPDQFVLKCNHDSGTLYICRDKSKVNIDDVKNRLRKSLKTNYYLLGREWPYKNVKRRVFAEKYMVDESGEELKDYKFFVFNGTVYFCKVDFDRFIGHHANYYTLDWSLLPFGETICPPDFERKLEKPINLDKMILLAQELAQGIPFARVDFYNINNHIYFGEITFYPASGFGKFCPSKEDYTLGDLIQLPFIS